MPVVRLLVAVFVRPIVLGFAELYDTTDPFLEAVPGDELVTLRPPDA